MEPKSVCGIVVDRTITVPFDTTTTMIKHICPDCKIRLKELMQQYKEMFKIHCTPIYNRQYFTYEPKTGLWHANRDIFG